MPYSRRKWFVPLFLPARRKASSTASSSVVWTVIACLGFAACDKKQPPAADPSAPPAKGAAKNYAAKLAPPPTSVTPPAPEAPTAAPSQPATGSVPASELNQITSGAQLDLNAGKELKGGELATPEIIASYNKRLAMVNYQISDYPQSLEQLKKWPMMPPPPKAPPGKQLVYDARTRKLRLDPP